MNVGSPFPWRVRALSRHASRATLALLLVPILGLVVQVSANASTASAGCADPMPYKWLPPGGVPRSNIDASGLAALAKAKADLDAGNTTLQTDLQRARALSGTPADVLRKRRARAASSAPSGASKLSMDAACGVRGAKRGSLFLQFQNRLASTALAADSVSSGPGYTWLDNLNEQGQDNSFYCGPATVSESTYTESVAVSQATAGGYMGTDGNGTSAGAMTSGMQHFVGYPVKNWSWYMWVDVPIRPRRVTSPTSGGISKWMSLVGSRSPQTRWKSRMDRISLVTQIQTLATMSKQAAGPRTGARACTTPIRLRLCGRPFHRTAGTTRGRSS